MDRIQELLARITELSDDELNELKDLILTELDGGADPAADPAAADGPPADAGAAMSLEKLEELAEASDAVTREKDRRRAATEKRAELAAKLNVFKDASTKVEPEPTPEPEKDTEFADKGEAPKTEEPTDASKEPIVAGSGKEPVVPADRQPKREVAKTTVITAGADLPGISMGSEFTSRLDMADAFSRRIDSMRGIRGADGDKMIVASARLTSMTDRHLRTNEAEENLRKVMDLIAPEAIVAAGGLGAPEESKYDLFGAGGDTDRPVKGALPVFTTDRGGVRFMRPPTLNDVNGVVGIWTIEDDINALTDVNVRKPSFRVVPGPEIVVNTQAITMIMTFGNLMSRAYPELVARHTDLAEVAHARVAEQQLLTQIGALSTAVTGRTQRVGAIREVMAQVSQAAASYRNRHRIKSAPLKAIMPEWFKDVLKADIALQHPGDGLEIFDLADAKIEGWFRSRNINVVWAMDGEAGQDYTSMTDGAGHIANYPTNVVWYLFAEGTFAFMDGGTLDLGLVRDSTLNAANDYQMFVETFENVVKFGHESLRVTSPLVPTGTGSADVTL